MCTWTRFESWVRFLTFAVFPIPFSVLTLSIKVKYTKKHDISTNLSKKDRTPKVRDAISQRGNNKGRGYADGYENLKELHQR